MVNTHVDQQTNTPTRPWKVVPTRWRNAKGGGKQPFQGYFVPGYKDKYEGNVNQIIFRSGIELRLFKYLDQQPNVVAWSSEETIIPYVSPVDNRVHRYFVDAKVTVKQKDGNLRTYLIEVKPSYQCSAPKCPEKPNRKSQARYLRESKTYIVNLAKWSAAEEVCAKKGWTFLKLTEKQLVF
jgi:hypothetical protein